MIWSRKKTERRPRSRREKGIWGRNAINKDNKVGGPSQAWPVRVLGYFGEFLVLESLSDVDSNIHIVQH